MENSNNNKRVEPEENLESCSERVSGVETCRVCQCLESDERGDKALEFLGIEEGQGKKVGVKKTARFTELVSPDGEVIICKEEDSEEDDIENGLGSGLGTLIELGCSCKNDMALVHYACALKWFINHGSTVCEICGDAAKNISTVDFRKVVCALKEYEALRERTASGEPDPTRVVRARIGGVDPDAVAAIRRQRLSEIALWFGLPSSGGHVAASRAVSEQSVNVVAAVEEASASENPATKWAVEGTGILLATGLLTVTLAWLIAPRVGKKTARSGLHILLGGICALTVVVFFRFFVLTRIKYGPARYWAILFVFWFLVFGIWASRAHGAR